MTTFASTKLFRPKMHWRPTLAPLRMNTFDQILVPAPTVTSVSTVADGWRTVSEGGCSWSISHVRYNVVPRRDLRYLTWQGKGLLGARWHLRHAAAIGERCRVWGRPHVIVERGDLVVGDRLQLMSITWATELWVGPTGRLEIGDEVFINNGCSIAATQLVRIGSRCNLGTHVQLMDNDWHRLEPDRRLERPPSRPIVLEDNVWLAASVLVLPGVTVGEGSVVGAGSVVIHDIPPSVLAVGVPARVVRRL